MPTQREFPYIWTTWLPRLFTGESNCEWAIWFKAHHQGWNRKPSDFNQADWLARHTALLNEHRDLWIQRGYDVRIEDQNAFRLRGHSATLAGKPDLLVLNKDHVLMTDVKTGRERPWHRYQLMIYMYALPRAMPEFREARIAGEIVYPNQTQRVPQGGIDQGFVRDLSALIRRIAAPEPQYRVPQRRRVPLLRHHGRRLPRPHRRCCQARYRRHRRLLTSSCSTSAVRVDSLSPSSSDIS